MYLDKSFAKEIVSSLSPYIDFDINIINTHGLILASTDPARENTVHEGALKLLRDELSILSIDSDDSFPRSRKGINMAIKYRNQTVGVIGITGDPHHVSTYGKLLKRMVELMLDENLNNFKNNSKETSALMLTADLIRGGLKSPAGEIKNRIAKAGLNPGGPFTAFILKTPSMPDSARRGAVKHFILKQLSGSNILCGYMLERYTAVSNLSHRQLRTVFKDLSESLNDHYNITSAFFLGGTYDTYSDIPGSYQEAFQMYNQYEEAASGIYEYDLKSPEIIINQIPRAFKKNLFDNIFKGCTQKEREEHCRFIRSYFRHNGSIKAIAEQEHIHKNTVQYKINKLFSQTGLDLRVSSDLLNLYIAAHYSDRQQV